MLLSVLFSAQWEKSTSYPACLEEVLSEGVNGFLEKLSSDNCVIKSSSYQNTF